MTLLATTLTARLMHFHAGLISASSNPARSRPPPYEWQTRLFMHQPSSRAMVRALERAQGAAESDDAVRTEERLTEANAFARRSADALQEVSDGAERLAAAI